MNREQRRKAIKGMSKERVEVTGITVNFKNGQYVQLDTTKVMITDRVTGKPLFEEILEPQAHKISDDNTTVGDSEIVQDDNWTGVRPKK
jgi:hypothetical protein